MLFATSLDHEIAAAQQAIRQEPRILENMDYSKGYYVSDAERHALQDSRQAAIEFKGDAYQLLNSFEWRSQTFFIPIHAQGDESWRYYMEEQWSEDDRIAHLAEGRKPYEFNVLRPYVDALLGEQIGQRTEWDAKPLIPTLPMQQQADIANHYLKWVQQANDNQWDQSASMAFRDAVVRNIGVAGVRMDPYDPMCSIEIDRYRPSEFMWDLESTKDGTLKGTRYLWRGYWRDRAQLSWEFKEWREELLTQNPMAYGSANAYDYNYSMQRPRARGTADSLGFSTVYNPFIRTMYGGLLYVREFYERRTIPKWKVRDGLSQNVYYFDDPIKAGEATRELRQFWMSDNRWQAIGASGIAVSDPMPCDVGVVDKYTWIGNLLVRIESQITNRFPYQFFIPDWYDGSIISYLELGKNRQRFLNRLISHIDQMAGGAKPNLIANKAFFSGKQSEEAAQEAFLNPGHIIWVDGKGVDIDISKAIVPTPVPNVGPMIMPLYNIISDSIKQTYGGSTQIGQAEYAGQSGVSQQALRAYAGTTTMTIFDKFGKFGQAVGEAALWCGQFLDPVTQMTIIDEGGDPQTKSFLGNGIKSFGDLKFIVRVAEKTVNPSEQQRRFGQFLQLMGQMPDRAGAFTDLILKYMDVPYNDKMQVIQAIQAQDQQQAQLAERAQALQEQQAETKDAVAKGGLMLKAAQLDLEARNQPKFLFTGNIPQTPGILASLFEQGGVQAHPAMIAADFAQKALLDQDVRNLAQVSEQSLWTPEQKKLMEATAASKVATVKSQKDAVSRSLKGEEKTE